MPKDESLTPERKISVTWDDPMIGAQSARSMSGLTYLQAIKDGELAHPPIANLLGFTMESIEPGRAVFELIPAEQHYNPIGMVHGGVISTVLDSAMACAVHSTLAAGTGYSTVEFKVNFVRPMNVMTGRVRCEANVIHSGGRISTAEGKMSDKDGKLFAHATTTCIILKPGKL